MADWRRDNIFRMAAAGGPHVPVGGSERFVWPYAVAYDAVRQAVFWTDAGWNEVSARGIWRLSPNATKTFYHTGKEIHQNLLERFHLLN